MISLRHDRDTLVTPRCFARNSNPKHWQLATNTPRIPKAYIVKGSWKFAAVLGLAVCGQAPPTLPSSDALGGTAHYAVTFVDNFRRARVRACFANIAPRELVPIDDSRADHLRGVWVEGAALPVRDGEFRRSGERARCSALAVPGRPIRARSERVLHRCVHRVWTSRASIVLSR